MDSAHDYGNAAQAVFAGNLVCAARGVGFHADADQVSRLVERNTLEAVVMEANLDAWRRLRGHRSSPERLHLPGSEPMALTRAFADSRMDERHPQHSASSSSAGTCQLPAGGGAPGFAAENGAAKRGSL